MTFPGLSYWARLPGFAAFFGASAGICAAKALLASTPGWAPKSLLYINLLIFATFFFAAAGILCRRARLRMALFAVCGAALFAGTELNLRDFYRKMEAVGENHQIFTLTARISSPVAETRAGYKFRCKVVGADGADVERVLKGKTLQCASRGPVPPFGIVTVQGRYSAPRPAAGPLGFDQREYFAVSNIHGSFTVSRVLAEDGDGIYNMYGRDASAPSAQKPPSPGTLTDKISHALRLRVHNIINKAKTQDALGIFHAAFLGEKEHLPESLNTLFRKAGIIHLLAISGFHAALLYSAIFAALGLLILPPRYRTLISLAALWCYLFFIGFIPSLFRATVMVTFFCVSMLFQRKNHVVHSLGIAGFFWLLISPHSLFAPGFQLSFAATAGIVLLQPALNAVTIALNAKIMNKPAEFVVNQTLSPLWVSLAGFAATAPPLLYHFGSLSLYGIFFNTVAIPLMSAAMWAFFAALVLSPVDILANAAVWCAEKTLGLMIALSKFSDKTALSEIVIPDVSALQLIVMVIFMVGLCTIRANLRAAYALRAGGVATLLVAATALYTSIQKTTENLEFRGANSTANVVIYKDNSAWVVAQGRKNEVRNLRVREIEPLLYRKKVRGVPLFVVNEEAEEEAHEFAFNTGFTPRMVVLRRVSANDRKSSDKYHNDGYTRVEGRDFVSRDETCSLSVNSEGRAYVRVRR